jgi:hypothetical protein
MRESDWSSDVCSSDLLRHLLGLAGAKGTATAVPFFICGMPYATIVRPSSTGRSLQLDLARVALLSAVVGIVGTGTGGVIVALRGNPSKRTLSLFLGISAGVMISMVAFDLMPGAFEMAGTWISLGAFLAGALALTALRPCDAPHAPHDHRQGELPLYPTAS